MCVCIRHCKWKQKGQHMAYSKDSGARDSCGPAMPSPAPSLQYPPCPCFGLPWGGMASKYGCVCLCESSRGGTDRCAERGRVASGLCAGRKSGSVILNHSGRHCLILGRRRAWSLSNRECCFPPSATIHHPTPQPRQTQAGSGWGFVHTPRPQYHKPGVPGTRRRRGRGGSRLVRASEKLCTIRQ